MLESILKRYPSMKSEDIGIQDNSDDKGAFISFWNSDAPKPSPEDLKRWQQEDAGTPAPLALEERIKELENVVNMLLLGGI